MKGMTEPGARRGRRQDAREVERYLRPTASHMSDLPLLELQCFSVPGARLDGSPAPPELLRRKHLALLVYLALPPHRRRTRAHLVGVLWPETRGAQARHSLNEAVRRLRTQVGEARLVSDGDAIVLRDEGLEVDALRFETLVEQRPADAARLVLGDRNSRCLRESSRTRPCARRVKWRARHHSPGCWSGGPPRCRPGSWRRSHRSRIARAVTHEHDPLLRK